MAVTPLCILRLPTASRILAAVGTLSRWVTFLEKYLLSLFFFFFAFREIEVLLARLPLFAEQRTLAVGTTGLFAIVVKHVLLLAFTSFAGAALLLNRPAVRPPQSLRDVGIPLLGTFFQYALAFHTVVPRVLTHNLMPVGYRNEAAVAALVVSLVGYAIAAWSVLSLGRSFSLLVAVRNVVHGGPYRYVRHPMYLGYILGFVGITLGAFCLFSIALTPAYVAVTIYRARLEEEALDHYSAEYHAYAARTGFLLPRLHAAAG
jgi:protein-S-isoprenylcysteine O-methyltransferase Ste14